MADMLLLIREVFRPYVREASFLVDLTMPHEQVLTLDYIMLSIDITGPAPPDEGHIFQGMLRFHQLTGRRGTYILGF